MNVGQRIREVREELGMQRSVLARRAGVAANHLYMIEVGERTPSLGLVGKIARELRTEPAELLKEPTGPLAPASRESGRTQPGVDHVRTPHEQLAVSDEVTPLIIWDLAHIVDAWRAGIKSDAEADREARELVKSSAT
jgi:transcriptional regulator with XRE-family HTH domain